MLKRLLNLMLIPVSEVCQPEAGIFVRYVGNRPIAYRYRGKWELL